MRYSRLFLPTLKEVPSEAEVISHKLMLRAGMIRKLASGLYTYLPLGLRSLQKVSKIIREEMNRAGAQELLMPMVQPAELWEESGRWEQMGKELLRLKDRHSRYMCLGPTHEEVITDLVRKEVRSYRELPLVLYQIQTKFRDERRPRFGLMRGREFIMKDAYSFDVDEDALDKTYTQMYRAYCRIFERCGLNFRAVEADTGAIGGNCSHEFMVLAETGEDDIAVCTQCSYAANVELAPALPAPILDEESSPHSKPKERQLVSTPGKTSIEEVSAFLDTVPSRLVKTLILIADGKPVAALVRGDHELNEVKVARKLGVTSLEMADAKTVEKLTNAPVGFAGPIDLDNSVRIIADVSLKDMKNFTVGANRKDHHYINCNWGMDMPEPIFADIRIIKASDPCPKCGGKIEIKRGIEVGHVFKLGTKYSESLGATYLDKDGKQCPMVMGCYGIGVGRTLAAAIEQHNDQNGIIFPKAIAPFSVIISLLNPKDEEMTKVAEKLYTDLESQGIETLLDDRNMRPGVKFKDAELIGIPLRITIGNKLKKQGLIELYDRQSSKTIEIPVDQAMTTITESLQSDIGA